MNGISNMKSLLCVQIMFLRLLLIVKHKSFAEFLPFVFDLVNARFADIVAMQLQLGNPIVLLHGGDQRGQSFSGFYAVVSYVKDRY